MPWILDDTIAAIASAPGSAARGIIRISGPQSIEIAAAGFLRGDGKPLSSNGAAEGSDGQWQLAEIGRPVPCFLMLWPTSRSYTRQPVAELHLPGAPPILEAALADVCRRGARLAEPGEFTLRAFLHGRLDLTQAEAVLGVIDARGETELRTALRQLAGGLARPLDELRNRLLDLLAHLEAGLDFVEEDIEFISDAELRRQLKEIQTEIDSILAQTAGRSAGTAIPRVVLRGRPNTGKSSLLNALAGRNVALVAEVAGTTRDYLSAEIREGDFAFAVIDTAGIEAAASAGPAADAQSHADEQATESALALFCLDATRPIDAWEQAELARIDATPRLIVVTKIDQGMVVEPPIDAVATSSLTGAGIDLLRQWIRDALIRESHGESGIVAATSVRCRTSLEAASEAVARALAAIEAGEELVAAELRLALQDLGMVVGTVYTDDVLDRIFGRFCIGK